MFIVKVQYVILVHLRIVRCHHRVEESPFLEAEKPTMGSLQLRRGVLHRPSNYMIVECSVRMSPGQEGVVLRVKRQTQDFWSQQKQAHLDSQAHLGSWPKQWLV